MNDLTTTRAVDERGLTVSTSIAADGVAVVTLAGRLDAVTAPDLRLRCDTPDVAAAPWLVFDLSDVVALDSAGLAVLIWTRRAHRLLGGDVVLIRPQDDKVMRVFRLTQFDEVFRMLPGEKV